MTNARVAASAEDGSMRIALSGEIDLANAAAVEDEIREAMSRQPAKVSVDLTDLTYLDSAGVRILFALASRLQALRIVLELIVPLDSPAHRAIGVRVARRAPPSKPLTGYQLRHPSLAGGTRDRTLAPESPAVCYAAGTDGTPGDPPLSCSAVILLPNVSTQSSDPKMKITLSIWTDSS